jgi:FkbM family methyltransferase
MPPRIAAAFTTQSRSSRIARPLVNRLVPREQTMIVVRSGPGQGMKLLIDPRSEKLLWTGAHEPEVQRVVTSLAPGDVFWDIGAHVGFFSILASNAVGDRGIVHAFEPIRHNRDRLHVALEQNGATNVVVHGVAIGERAGEAPIFDRGSSFTWSLAVESDSMAHVTQTVPVLSLDDLTSDLGAPTLLKIDAEGAELAVLRGGRRLFTEYRPRVILEASDPAALPEVKRLLADYSIEPLEEAHYLLTRQL